MLLSRPSESEKVCELQLKVFPRYKIESISLICSVPKLEIFVGNLKEYLETIYGILLDDNDDNNGAGEPEIPKSYRYDIEVEKSGVVELYLKVRT